MDKFAEESGKEGFILFSLGSIKSSENMPKEYLKVFFDVFTKIPQRVIWKWDGDQKPDNIPANIMMVKWLPQQDILGLII